MTHDEWVKLHPKEQRVIVAELCGWKHVGWGELGYLACGYICCNGEPPYPSKVREEIPNYLTDLNAMQAVDAYGVRKMRYYPAKWAANMYKVLYGNELPRTHVMQMMTVLQATAAQRAEAFVLTMTQGKQ